jgi:integrase
MPKKAYTRQNGIKLGRLPSYAIVSNPDADRHLGAVALSVEMLKFVTHKATIRVNGKASSHRTIDAAKDVLGEMCLRLWRLGFRVQSIAAINGKHIEAVVRDHWACGASPKYMSSIMTQLKKLDDWLGKPGLAKSIGAYLPEVDLKEFSNSMVAAKSKSWSENGIDLSLKIAEADRKDHRFGLMLRMCLALGLRRCEVLQIIPWKDDRGSFFDIRPGIAKGGRARTIPYLSPAQKEIVDYIKSQLKRTEFLGWTDPVLRGDGGLLLRNEKRYSQYMTDIGISKAESGVTGHGLRAEYAENMSILMGLIPATRGGTKGQMSQEEEDTIRLQVSENMGHSRTNVTNAYFGKLTKKIQNSRGERLGTISLSNRKLAAVYMNPPPRKTAHGEYPRLQKRTVDTTNILVVIEASVDGLLSEVVEFSFKDTDVRIQTTLQRLNGNADFEYKGDAADLKRLGSVLLGKFGVVLVF